MSKKFKLILTMLMIVSLTLMMSSLAVGANAGSNDEKNKILSRFSVSEKIIKSSIDSLLQSGKIYEPKEDSNKLAKTVESKSGLTLNEVKTSLNFDLFNNHEAGIIDTERFNLDEETMEQVMTSVLKDASLTDKVTYEFVVIKNIVKEINYEIRNSFAVGLDEINQNGSTETIEIVSAGVEGQVVASAQNDSADTKVNLMAVTAENETEADADSDADSDITYSAEFVWEQQQVIDENNHMLAYDAENKAIQVVTAYTLDWVCTGVNLIPSDGGDSILIKKENLAEAFTLESNVIDEAAITENPALAADYGSTFYTAAFNDTTDAYKNADGGSVFSETINITKKKLQIHWAQMCTFNRDNAQYFGVANPYWTSLNTESSPMGALKSLVGYEDEFVPDSYMDLIVDQLGQAFISYVYSYAPMMDAMLNDAMGKIDSIESDSGHALTDVQKMLVLHDWLANEASFDMETLISIKSDSDEGADPIGMTAFGALLKDQIGIPGCVCLGYAAAYSLLIQWEYPDIYKNDDGTWKTADEVSDTYMTDFVEMKFHANVAETSVAGENSGFGTDTIFNEPHYFNAVKLFNEDGSYDWYYIDVCYDDVSGEVISQCRVETEGFISHRYFLLSPQTVTELYDGYFDFIGSLYDGGHYERTPVLDADGNLTFDETGAVQYETGEDGLPVYHFVADSEEKSYNNTQYEDAWFSVADSEIYYYQNNWYYVGSSFNLVGLLDIMEMMDEMGDVSNDTSGMEEMMGGGAEYGDKLVSRPISSPDNSSGGSGGSSGQGGMAGMEAYNDEYASTLFHYGYGTIGDPETTEDSDGNTIYGPYGAEVQEDENYNDIYPELVHTIGMDNDNIYFNLSNKIYIYNIAAETITQFKEYNDVYAAQNSSIAFTGMSFYTTKADGSDVIYTLRDHPLAAVAIQDKVVWSDSDGDQQNDTRNIIPTLTASIATNYSESNATEKLDADGNVIVDEDGNAVMENYKEEAVNYNPSYSKKNSDKDDNSNAEFMWCANVIDVVELQSLLADYNDKDNYSQVDITAWCTTPGFSEMRSSLYGLSDGTTVTIKEDEPVIGHNFVFNEKENCDICINCKHVKTEEDVDPNAELVLNDNSGLVMDISEGEEGSSKYLSQVEPGTKPADISSKFKTGGAENTVVIVDAAGNELTGDDAVISTGSKVQQKNAAGEVVDEAIIIVAGDINGDGDKNNLDAIYLLYSFYEAEEYPIVGQNSNYDYNGDELVNNNDVCWLLYNLYEPEDFPLY